MKVSKKAVAVVMAAAVASTTVMACNNKTTGTGAASSSTGDTAITIGDSKIPMGDALVYVYVLKSQYESYYGSEVWSTEVSDGQTFGQSIKDMITDQLVQLQVLSNQAEEYGVTLSDEDQTSVADYVTQFTTQVGEETMTANGFSADDVKSVMELSTLASNVYSAIVEKQEGTLTDDEKADLKCIKVKHILLSTMDTTTTDADGNKTTMSDEEITAYKEAQKAKAEEALQKINDGEDFDTVLEEYSPDTSSETYSLDKNGQCYSESGATSTLVEPFYTAAWKLSDGGVSDVVETDYGYHIIKCVSADDTDATQWAQDYALSSKKTEAAQTALQALIEAAQPQSSSAWEAYTITATETTADTAAAESTTSAETETAAK